MGANHENARSLCSIFAIYLTRWLLIGDWSIQGDKVEWVRLDTKVLLRYTFMNQYKRILHSILYLTGSQCSFIKVGVRWFIHSCFTISVAELILNYMESLIIFDLLVFHKRVVRGVVSQLKLCVCQQTCLTMTIVGSVGARPRDGYRGLINNRPYFFPCTHHSLATGFVSAPCLCWALIEWSRLHKHTGMFMYHLSNIFHHHYIVYLLGIFGTMNTIRHLFLFTSICIH